MCNRDASFNHEKYLESNSKYKNLHIFIIIRNHSKDGVLVVINTSKQCGLVDNLVWDNAIAHYAVQLWDLCD